MNCEVVSPPSCDYRLTGNLCQHFQAHVLPQEEDTRISHPTASPRRKKKAFLQVSKQYVWKRRGIFCGSCRHGHFYCRYVKGLKKVAALVS